jgi:hypothetical protein
MKSYQPFVFWQHSPMKSSMSNTVTLVAVEIFFEASVSRPIDHASSLTLSRQIGLWFGYNLERLVKPYFFASFIESDPRPVVFFQNASWA